MKHQPESHHTNPASLPSKLEAMGRRRFLQHSAAGLAGMALSPTILSQNAKGANNRIRLGMIGVGTMGSLHVQGFSGIEDTAIVAIADAYLPRAEERVKWLHDNGRVLNGQKVDAYQDYRRILERDDIDAVVIATPEHWHALNTIHAAQAGKHIYCQKPFAQSVWEGRQMVKAVNKYKVVLQTGSQQRSSVISNIGITHLRNGTLGKITRVLANAYGSPLENGWPGMPVPGGLDWDLWCGPAPKPEFNHAIWSNDANTEPTWSGIRLFGGGTMTDWGGHGLDMIQWGLGMDHTGPEEIWVEGEPFMPVTSTPQNTGGRRKGPNMPKIFMKYANGVIVEFEGGDVFGGTFICENGQMNITRQIAKSDPVELTRKPLENPKVEIYRGYDYAKKNSHDRNWLECIKTGAVTAAPAETGHRSATVCHLGNIARWVSSVTGETGQKLKWDSVNERFTNSDVANQFLRRSYRPGYEVPEVV
jgi:predicted dehydrogenase